MRRFLKLLVGLAVFAAASATVPVASGAGASSLHVPKAGTAVDAVDPSTIAGAYRLDTGEWAVPLRSERPEWVTEDLLAAAANGPVAAPASAPDLPASGFVGIRPGSWMVEPHGCTMNFVFQKNGVFAIGTAGHCVDKVGQPVTLLTVAPGTNNPVLVTIGSVLSKSDNGIGDDFALVSIKPELQSWVFPTIAQVGGPCGLYTAGDGGYAAANLQNWNQLVRGEEPAEPGQTVYHYGHGLALGTGGTSRGGVATSWGSTAYYWAGAVIFGDSGSAARVGSFEAAGDITHLVVGLKIPGYNAGTRIAKMLQLAKGWELTNSPHCLSVLQ